MRKRSVLCRVVRDACFCGPAAPDGRKCNHSVLLRRRNALCGRKCRDSVLDRPRLKYSKNATRGNAVKWVVCSTAFIEIGSQKDLLVTFSATQPPSVCACAPGVNRLETRITPRCNMRVIFAKRTPHILKTLHSLPSPCGRRIATRSPRRGRHASNCPGWANGGNEVQHALC